jgi:hypothetical protein
LALQIIVEASQTPQRRQKFGEARQDARFLVISRKVVTMD